MFKITFEEFYQGFLEYLSKHPQYFTLTSVINEREHELKKRSTNTIPIHQCFCGCHPELHVEKECCGHGDYDLQAWVECRCGLRSKIVTIDGQGYYIDLEKTGHANTADDAVMFWNNLFKKRGTKNEENT